MAEWGIDAKARASGEIVSVFDPCAARDKPDTCASVRKILEAAGFVLEPLSYEKERAQCCSWGGQISIAAPKYSKWLTQTIVGENERPYVVYCSNCRDIFASAGKPVKHILDVIFDSGDWTFRPPTVSQRRQNRIYLRKSVMGGCSPEAVEGGAKMSKLIMSGEIREKLDKSRLLEEDVLSVIEAREADGGFVVDADTSRRFACGVVGNLTHWAEYIITDGGYELINAYSHRMTIETEDARK
jgi:hypothetical protein